MMREIRLQRSESDGEFIERKRDSKQWPQSYRLAHRPTYRLAYRPTYRSDIGQYTVQHTGTLSITIVIHFRFRKKFHALDS